MPADLTLLPLPLPRDAHVVILAGGEGTRLWPLSRGHRPKQILPLFRGRSLIQQTVARVLPMVPPERILVVTERSHADDLRAQLPELPQQNVMVETSRRNTAAALLLAALNLQERADTVTWASLHSDAYVGDDDEFRRTLAAALVAAEDGRHLVTTGIRPQYPATGYGYIHQGPKLRDVGAYPLHAVERFVEKPDLETARAYVASGEYLWNPGVFVWRNDTLIEAFRQYEPEILRVLTSAPLARIADVYDSAPRQTIDNGILERASNVATIPATFRWSDLGSWSELWETLDKDAAENVTEGSGEVLLEDSQRNLVYADARLVALVGVQDLVVVETADAVFICPRDRAPDVRAIVRRLQTGGRSELL